MAYSIDKSKLLDCCIQFLLAIYVCLALIAELRLFPHLHIAQFILILSGCLPILVNLVYRVRLKSNFDKAYLMAFIIGLFVLINSIFIRKYILFGSFFNLLVGVAVGEYLGKTKNPTKILLIPFWFILAYILFKLRLNPDPNEVFIRSRNYISFFLLITVAPYYYSRINARKDVSVIPALITLLISLYCLGRSGIITSLFLVIAVFSSYELKKHVKVIILGIVSVFLFFGFSYFLSNYASFKDIQRIVKIASWSELGGRSTFWANYIRYSNFTTFLFGMEINVFRILNLGGNYLPGHVHSSILNFISVTGVSAFYYFIFLTKRLYRVRKVNIGLILLAVAFYARIFSETGCLFGYFDYAAWMFLFSRK